jgi:peroxiredoxin
MAACCLDNRPKLPSRFIAKRIGEFTLPRVSDGQPESLYGNHSQKATVLLFLSAHCPCSQSYDERTREIADLYLPKGVRFIGVNSAYDESIAEVREHATRNKFSFPILKDEGNQIANRVGAQLTPEVFVMDSQEILRYHGRIDNSRDPKTVTSNDLQNALDALLAGRLPSNPDRTAFGCAISRNPYSNVR